MRAIALDLDGTLLDSNKEIASETKIALKELHTQGVEILVVTGRPYATTFPIAMALDVPLTVICYNGARVMDLTTDTVLFEKVLAPEHVQKIIDFSHRHPLSLNLFQNDLWYLEDPNCAGAQYYGKSSKMIPNVKNFKTFEDYHMLKAVIVDEPENLQKIEKGLKDILRDSVYFTYSQTRYLELLNRDVNKGVTLKNVLAQKGIDLSQCIAFGDAQNDIEMLSLCGIGVAMGNAHPELKKHADFITDTNDNHGVAKFIKNNMEIFKNRQD